MEASFLVIHLLTHSFPSSSIQSFKTGGSTMEDIRSSDEMIDDGDLSEDEDDEVNQDERLEETSVPEFRSRRLYVVFLTTVQASGSRAARRSRKGRVPRHGQGERRS